MLALFGCSGGSASAPAANGGTSVTAHKYNGTASVGDFLSITVDPSAKTIAYIDASNGDSGTVPYSVNSDGSYAITDPKGNLVSAYEVPGYAMLIAVEKAGADHATPALVTAVESGPISATTFNGQTYNSVQFRTTAGGFEAGAISVDSNGNISGSSFWPYGSFNPGGASPFVPLGGISLAAATQDVSQTFFKINHEGETSYLFGTANGQFLVDTPNGAILGLKQAAGAAFDPASAGTYGAIYYKKDNASTGMGNVEIGTASLQKASITIDTSANITVTNADGSTVVSAHLTPVADAAYLVGAGKLTNSCPGLFTFRLSTATTQQDVFVGFQGRALFFASFTGNVASAGGPAGVYAYAYGAGLR